MGLFSLAYSIGAFMEFYMINMVEEAGFEMPLLE